MWITLHVLIYFDCIPSSYLVWMTLHVLIYVYCIRLQGKYWWYCWKWVSPLLITIILFANIIRAFIEPTQYEPGLVVGLFSLLQFKFSSRKRVVHRPC